MTITHYTLDLNMKGLPRAPSIGTRHGPHCTTLSHPPHKCSNLFIMKHVVVRLASRRLASYSNAFLLPPTMKLRQGNIFTPVCQSFYSQWGRGSLSGRPPWTETPDRDPSPWTETPFHRDPSPFTETPLDRAPRQRPPGQRPPSPWTETPLDIDPSGQRHP